METAKIVREWDDRKDVAPGRDVKGPGGPRVSGTRKSRILVVDDDASVREMLLTALSFMDYEAVAARNAAEAMDAFAGRSFDLVITDLQMPGVDGRELSCRIKERVPGTPVILMTAQTRGYVMKDLQNSCFDSALFKPFGLSELQQELQRVLEGRLPEKPH